MANQVKDMELINTINEYMKTFDITDSNDLEIVNMLSRAREILIHVDAIIKEREKPSEPKRAYDIEPIVYEPPRNGETK